MAKSKSLQDLLIEILEKKAKGYYYEETQYEYQKTQNNENITAKTHKINQNIDFFDVIDRGNNSLEDNCDMIELSDRNEKNNSNLKFNLTKKKVTTHYVQPDLQAIKLLNEIYSNKDNKNSIENLSNDELIALKNKLIKELTNDNFANDKTN